MIEHDRVLDALSGVRDPELDEPVTDLGFVTGLRVEDGAVSVRLRLPTYFCAPNFAYLMVADATEAVLSVPGVLTASVVLEDHYASEELNTTLDAGGGFDEAFPGETEGPNLGELRSTFRRKSFVSRQERLCRALLAQGSTPEELATMTLGDVPPSSELGKYLERRSELGLEVSPGTPFLVDPDGRRVPEEAVVQHLRFAKTVRVSIDGNAGLCRGLLETRYGGERGVGQREGREEATV
jgi:metal-sulfur cluster biosynthetic enzyme